MRLEDTILVDRSFGVLATVRNEQARMGAVADLLVGHTAPLVS